MGVTAQAKRLHPKYKEWRYNVMLTIKYERISFFGKRHIYTEDSIECYSKEDIKKAFMYLGKNCDVAVQKENVIYFWDNTIDFENRIMSMRTFDTVNCMSYTDGKMAFDKAKKECYASVK